MKGKDQHDNERALIERAQTGDTRAIDELLKKYLPLIERCASAFGTASDKDDLVQEGLLELLTVVRELDVSRKFQTLRSLIRKRMKFCMRGYVLEHCQHIKLPWRVSCALNRIDKTVSEWSMVLGREPSIAELSGSTQLTEEEISRYRSYRCSVESMDQYSTDIDEVESSAALVVADDSCSPEQQAALHERKSFVDRLLDQLSERERTVLDARFAITRPTKLTLEEAGRLLGVKKQRAKQIEDGAVRKLRDLIRRASERVDEL